MLAITARAAETGSLPRTILFVDDADVLYRPGTIKRVETFAKDPGNPVLRPTKPWESTIGWMSVGRSPITGRFQMWYQARATSGSIARELTDEELSYTT